MFTIVECCIRISAIKFLSSRLNELALGNGPANMNARLSGVFSWQPSRTQDNAGSNPAPSLRTNGPVEIPAAYTGLTVPVRLPDDA